MLSSGIGTRTARLAVAPEGQAGGSLVYVWRSTSLGPRDLWFSAPAALPEAGHAAEPALSALGSESLKTAAWGQVQQRNRTSRRKAFRDVLPGIGFCHSGLVKQLWSPQALQAGRRGRHWGTSRPCHIPPGGVSSGKTQLCSEGPSQWLSQARPGYRGEESAQEVFLPQVRMPPQQHPVRGSRHNWVRPLPGDTSA